MNVPENILDEMARKLTNQNRRIVMPRAKKTTKKKTTSRKRTPKTKQIDFFTKVVNGWKKIFSPAK